MTVRNLSPATRRSHVHAAARFSRFFGRSPDRLTLQDVRTFQVHLASKGVAWASLAQTVAALRLFHRVTLGMAGIPERIAHAREPRRLPVAPSADEVAPFLEAVPSLKARAALATACAAGLRVSEVTGLRVADIAPEARLRRADSGRMMIRIEHGKGGEERHVMPPAQLPAIPRTCRRLARPDRRLFPARDATRRIEPTTPHAACRSARAAAGIGKTVTLPVLRRGFATHLLERGVDVRVIQVPPARAHLSTTARCTHVSQGLIVRTASPLEWQRLDVAPPTCGAAMAGGLAAADVFRRHGPAFRAARGGRLDRDQRRVTGAT